MVTFPPGGSSDAIIRILSTRLNDKLGQALVIDNRPGAGGNIGLSVVAKAAPDGYTILIAANPLVIVPSQSLKPAYDPAKDFKPIVKIGVIPLVLAVTPSLKINSLKELVAYAKANPRKLTYASGGNGASTHLAGELLKMVVLIGLCGWCIWKMPLAAQLWHAGHARTASRDLVGVVVLMIFVAAAAFLTLDKGPLLVIALLLTVLLATVLGWTAGMGMLVLGFAIIFLIGVDLDVVGERLQAWRDPFTADRDDMARLMWFQSEAARFAWGFGVGQVPWCGTSRLDLCHGLPLQLQSDYTFTALVGWWGPQGAWLW